MNTQLLVAILTQILVAILTQLFVEIRTQLFVAILSQILVAILTKLFVEIRNFLCAILTQLLVAIPLCICVSVNLNRGFPAVLSLSPHTSLLMLNNCFGTVRGQTNNMYSPILKVIFCCAGKYQHTQ